VACCSRVAWVPQVMRAVLQWRMRRIREDEARMSAGVPVSLKRCEDGATMEFSGNMMMEEEGGTK